MLADDTSGKDLRSRTQPEQTPTMKTTDDPIKTETSRNRHLCQEDTQMAGEFADGRSRSLAVRKTEIRTVMGHCSTPTRTAIAQTGLTSVGKDMGKPKPACPAGRNLHAKWHSLPLWRMERAARHGRRSPCAPALMGADPRGTGTRPHRSSAEMTPRSRKLPCTHTERNAALTRATTCAERRQHSRPTCRRVARTGDVQHRKRQEAGERLPGAGQQGKD